MTEGERFSLEKGPKVLALQDVMDSSREVPEAYKALILAQEQRGFYLPQSFAEHWDAFLGNPDQFPHTRDFLKKRLASDLLIDVGGGTGNPEFAHYFGAAGYINVDRDMEGKDAPANPLAALREVDREGMHLIDVKADMLDFVARMRDGSANFVLNGIDLSAINDGSYHEALAQELSRATKPGGLVFGVNSYVDQIWQSLGDKAPLKKKQLDLWLLNSFIYQRPE